MLYELIQYFDKSPYHWTFLHDSKSNNEQTIRDINFHTNSQPCRCFSPMVTFCKNLMDEYHHVREEQQKSSKCIQNR